MKHNRKAIEVRETVEIDEFDDDVVMEDFERRVMDNRYTDKELLGMSRRIKRDVKKEYPIVLSTVFKDSIVDRINEIVSRKGEPVLLEILESVKI